MHFHTVRTKKAVRPCTYLSSSAGLLIVIAARWLPGCNMSRLADLACVAINYRGQTEAIRGSHTPSNVVPAEVKSLTGPAMGLPTSAHRVLSTTNTMPLTAQPAAESVAQANGKRETPSGGCSKGAASGKTRQFAVYIFRIRVLSDVGLPCKRTAVNLRSDHTQRHTDRLRGFFWVRKLFFLIWGGSVCGLGPT